MCYVFSFVEYISTPIHTPPSTFFKRTYYLSLLPLNNYTLAYTTKAHQTFKIIHIYHVIPLKNEH